MGDSSKNADHATGPNPDRGRRQVHALPGCLVALATLLILFVGIPYALLALAFWAADGSWDFEGDKSFRYWFFISGKRAEKLGVVVPTDKPVKYSVSESDGNFPGWVIVQYESKAAPAEVIEFYAKRCGAEKATVIKRTEPKQDGDKIRVELDCEFPSFHTAEFLAERTSSSELSKVSLRVWGRE
jgi:hypothetical protein